MTADFHFLRPWWLLATLPALWMPWMIWRSSDVMASWRGVVADHLVAYLVKGGSARRRQGPVLLLLAGWVTAALILSGPVWKRERSPFADDAAALAIVVKVSPSMETEDIEPSRLIRSTQKIHDLLSRRGGAKSSLIAYSGSAHVVMPATADGGIVDTFAAALDPSVMPRDGDVSADALKLADASLAKAGGGSILWITDGIAPEQASDLLAWRKSSPTGLQILAPLPDSSELSSLRSATATMRGKVIPLVADDSDVSEIERASKFASSAGGEGADRWQDSGYWLTPALALMVLPFFRRGWMPALAARS